VPTYEKQIDEIDSEMIDYMAKNGKAKAGELAALIGISVPSIRYRLFQLMAYGLVSQEKTRDHHVWFFVNNETKKEAPPLKPPPSQHALFVECLHKVYDLGVVELKMTDPENDFVCLALSNTLDELSHLVGIYDLLAEAAR